MPLRVSLRVHVSGPVEDPGEAVSGVHVRGFDVVAVEVCDGTPVEVAV